ncbi:MAG: terpene cyclase/mutase family protein [Thermoguttaceae bacterium]
MMSLNRGAPAQSTDRRDKARKAHTSNSDILKILGTRVRRAITRTRQWLLNHQHADGSWCAELQGDTILESETILLLAFLGQVDSELAQNAATYLIDNQLPDGGWAMYPGGGVAISASVEAYFALKLTGHDPSTEYMRRARDAILAHGGADAVNSYTRFFLALLGQISYEQCPAVPPELMLLPKWCPINLYAVSSWSRTIIVPLSIVSALRPVRKLEDRFGIRELFLRDPKDWPQLRCPGLKGGGGWFSWDRFFHGIDKMWKWFQRRRLLPFRNRAIESAKKWMLDRFQQSDGLGAIYPPIVWSYLALKSLGYAEDSTEVAYCRKQLEDLVIYDSENGTARLQPCKSPVWDTAITLRTLSTAGMRPDAAPMSKAMSWLWRRQIVRPGDWSETVDVQPGAWCFEYSNDFYPDVDDTAMALMALQAQLNGTPEEADSLPPQLHIVSEELETAEPVEEDFVCLEQTVQAIQRGMKWLLAMQNKDGGWGAFDRDNNCEFLCYVPFADHNAMIDPSTPDVTGRVLEALGCLGLRVGNPAVDRAVDYVRRRQEADSSWFGRWGVNYIYGTWQAVTGLTAVGVAADDPAVVAGADWLLTRQQACGGWGESPDSYERPHLRGQGPVTASQTAWAVMGLIAAGMERHPAVAKAIRHLTQSQNEDGIWDEKEFTGTGFPRVFYLRYHYYPIYFPLLAMSQWARKVRPKRTDNELPAVRKKTFSRPTILSAETCLQNVCVCAENF